jgi:hypothetical protein
LTFTWTSFNREINRSLRRATAAAGCWFAPHSARHAYATLIA